MQVKIIIILTVPKKMGEGALTTETKSSKPASIHLLFSVYKFVFQTTN